MNRRHFIKYSSLTAITITALPQFAFSQNIIPNDELIGKGNPELFGNGYKLRKEAHESFLKMQADAKKEGINIAAASSYRS